MECIFCKIVRKEIQANILFEDDCVMAFLDCDPISEGHILIIPKQHFGDVDELPRQLLFRLAKVSQKIVKAIKSCYLPDGYGVMQNGGQFNDIGHYHLHIFPRYKNDGFGWTCAQTKAPVSQEVVQKIILHMS